MTPAARVQAAIEILDRALTGDPAEQVLTTWARRSRYAGSKDRRAVRDLVYQALRNRRSFAALGGGLTGRELMIGAVRADGQTPEDIFTGQGYGPAVLSEAEKALPAGDDANADWNLPDWLIRLFETSLGDEAYATAQALTRRAPVMLRVNLRKATPEQAITSLADEGVTATPHAIATTSLIVTDGAPRITNSAAYLSGLVELQDGASQAAMQGVQIAPDSRVLDYCAGGGGKTLALAARAEALWFAHDSDPRRMGDLAARAARAGVAVDELDTGSLRNHSPFDTVLVDAPCSGSGTWRRTPEAKWTLTEARLDEIVHLQCQIMAEAARLVTTGGQLIYATCSLLAPENRAQVERFLDAHPDWHLASDQIWPVSAGGDGFYVAHLHRVAA